MRWRIAQTDPVAAGRLARELGLSPFLAGILASRGQVEPADVERMLSPRLADVANPLDLPAVRVAAERVCRAVSARERIVVYGDYDVDGVTAVSLLLSFFRDIGVPAQYAIPSRFVDGYGLNMERSREIAAGGPGLVITVDCGSTSVDEVDFLAGQGVDVIVTDHHRLQEARPRCVVLVNPQAWDGSPYVVLAGVGVAFLLVSAVCVLLRQAGHSGAAQVDLRRYLDIVTIGTVADMVPLTGVNRPLVVSGLKLMGAEPTRPGVVALKEVCGMAARPLEAGTIAFHLAPRLNAAGRLGSAQTGIELLMAPGYAQALPLARKLDEDNRQRQQIEAAVVKMADDLARDPATGNAPPALVLASPQWHIGVLGIVASRLVEKHYRPTVLLNVEGDEACGSARSIPGFNIGGALESCSSLLMRHGGHAMAAGLSLATANIDALRERLQHLVASTLSPEDMTPVLKVDAVLPLRCVTSETLSDMERLAPFGMGNPEPVLASPDLRVIQKKLVGSGEHLKLVVESEGRRVEAIGYRLSRLPVEVGDVVEAAFIPEMRTFLGVTSLQLRLKDVRRNGGA